MIGFKRNSGSSENELEKLSELGLIGLKDY